MRKAATWENAHRYAEVQTVGSARQHCLCSTHMFNTARGKTALDVLGSWLPLRSVDPEVLFEEPTDNVSQPCCESRAKPGRARHMRILR